MGRDRHPGGAGGLVPELRRQAASKGVEGDVQGGRPREGGQLRGERPGEGVPGHAELLERRPRTAGAAAAIADL